MSCGVVLSIQGFTLSVGSHMASLAAVIVDDNEGQDSYVAVEFARVDSVLEAELAAISMALSLARNRGYDHMERLRTQPYQQHLQREH
ncbi:hypothetical protein F8388_014730 [Cannabis sativa]|uniref:RNase H type-1 domain-containing protein n=1 Tax=Cannabis sativa TaxID=3483 RepID=A0A7J6GYN5_CANSA|nr:hypothetical protein F8388_014730 [Cannabis sativa]